MNKKEFVLRRKFKNIPENSKFIFFRNPKEFIFFNLESINPNRKFLIWGKLKKKRAKHRTNNFIQVGKIIFPLLLLFPIKLSFILECLIPAIDDIMLAYLMIECYLYVIKFGGLTKCLKWLIKSYAF